MVAAAEALARAAAQARSPAVRIDAMYHQALALRDIGDIERAWELSGEICAATDSTQLDQFRVQLGLYRESADENFLMSLRGWFYARARRRTRARPLRTAFGPSRGTLRVGFLGLDIAIPCYSALVTPLMRALDPAKVEVLAFVVNAPEATLDRLRRQGLRAFALQADARPDAPGAAAATARQLAAYDLDVLVDLGDCLGPTPLLVLHRPAPAQVSWQNMLGPCPDPAIDLLFGNAAIYPPAQADAYGGKAALLPVYLFVYDPNLSPERPPPPSPPPCLKTGYVTFGSLSNLYKMGEASLALWAKVQRAVPGSRLRLGNAGLAEADVRARVHACLVRHGADPASIEFGAVSGWPDYLAAYDGIDIALATVPVAGGTTLFEAVYQGVPVLSRVYPSPLGRIGRWLEGAIDRPGTAHDSDESLVGTARAWAADIQGLARFRANARADFDARTARDTPRQARAFEALLFEHLARRRTPA